MLSGCGGAEETLQAVNSGGDLRLVTILIKKGVVRE